jgi:hypothetical protein
MSHYTEVSYFTLCERWVQSHIIIIIIIIIINGYKQEDCGSESR